MLSFSRPLSLCEKYADILFVGAALDVSGTLPGKTKFTENVSREPSKALEAEWLAATSQTKNLLLSIDCTAEAELCREQGIISYPAIRVFDGSDKVRRYKGARKASA
jgi:Thioredoxin